MGGLNHCTSHCRLVKIRGLTYGGKYSAVIGRGTRLFVCAQCKYAGYGFFSQSQRCICPRTSNHGFSPNDSVKYSGWNPKALNP